MDTQDTSPCPTCRKQLPTHSLLIHSLHCARRASTKLVPCLFCELPLALGPLSHHEAACGARTEPCASCGSRVMLRDWDAHASTCGTAPPASTPPTPAPQPAPPAPPPPDTVWDAAAVLTHIGVDPADVSPATFAFLVAVEDTSASAAVQALRDHIDDVVAALLQNPDRAYPDAGALAVQLALWTRFAAEPAVADQSRVLLGHLLAALPAYETVSPIHAPGIIHFPSPLAAALLDVVLPLLVDRTFALAAAPLPARHASYYRPADLADATLEPAAAADAWFEAPWVRALPSLEAHVCAVIDASPAATAAAVSSSTMAALLVGERAAEVGRAEAELAAVAAHMLPLLGPRSTPGAELDVAGLAMRLAAAASWPHAALGEAVVNVLAALLARFPSFGAVFMDAWLPLAATALAVAPVVDSTSAQAAGRVARAVNSAALAARVLWRNPHLLRTRAHVVAMVQAAERVAAAVWEVPGWGPRALAAFTDLMRGAPTFLYAKDVPYLLGCGDMVAALALNSPAARHAVGIRILAVTGAGGDGPHYGSLHTSLTTLHMLDRVLGTDAEPDAVRPLRLEVVLWAVGLLAPKLNEAPPLWVAAATPLVCRIVAVARSADDWTATDAETAFIDNFTTTNTAASSTAHL